MLNMLYDLEPDGNRLFSSTGLDDDSSDFAVSVRLHLSSRIKLHVSTNIFLDILTRLHSFQALQLFFAFTTSPEPGGQLRSVNIPL